MSLFAPSKTYTHFQTILAIYSQFIAYFNFLVFSFTNLIWIHVNHVFLASRFDRKFDKKLYPDKKIEYF